jgi:integrase
VLTSAYAGLRFGELAALRAERLDLLRRTIRVEETLNEVRGRIVVGPAKTKASRRLVSLPAFLAGELEDHLAAFPPSAGLVFTSDEGDPLRRNNFRRRAWPSAVRRSVGEPCRFHDLRHSHAALLIAGGVHPKVLQDRLGHASIRTTLDTYGHLFEGLDAAAAEALDTAWRGALAASLRPEGGLAVFPMAAEGSD